MIHPPVAGELPERANLVNYHTLCNVRKTAVSSRYGRNNIARLVFISITAVRVKLFVFVSLYCVSL